MKITAGADPDRENADIVVICAGVAQKPGNPGWTCFSATPRCSAPSSGR